MEGYIDFHQLAFLILAPKPNMAVLFVILLWERLGERKEVEELYRQMGQKFKDMDTWSIVLTAEEEFEKYYGVGLTESANSIMAG